MVRTNKSKNQEKVVKEGLEPYSSNQDFLNDLSNVMKADYGVDYLSRDLIEAGQNLNVFLRAFL